MAGQWTHVIEELTADELEASENGNASSNNGLPIASPRTSLVVFEPKVGQFWIIISIYCKANGADTIPKLRPYFYDQKQSEILGLLGITPSEFHGKGDLIFRKDSSGNEIKTLSGQTEKYVLAPVYVGNYSLRLALEECEEDADLVIVVDRVSIEQLPSY